MVVEELKQMANILKAMADQPLKEVQTAAEAERLASQASGAASAAEVGDGGFGGCSSVCTAATSARRKAENRARVLSGLCDLINMAYLALKLAAETISRACIMADTAAKFVENMAVAPLGAISEEDSFLSVEPGGTP